MKQGRERIGVVVACILSVSSIVSADVVDVPSARDNTLYEDVNGFLSNGSGQHFFCGATTLLEIRRGLVYFDVASALPPGSVINSVTLTQHCSRTPPAAGPTPISLHPVLADWGEGASDAPDPEGAGAPAEPGDATWLHTFFDTEFWTNEGGDFDPTASDTLMIGNTGFYSWSSGLMAADVQGWLDDPATNFGWMLVGDEQVERNARRFDTRENPTNANRPVLSIDFTPPDIVFVCPDVFEILRGIQTTGDSSNVCVSDDVRWGFQPDVFAATLDPPIRIGFGGQVSGAANPDRYTFKIELRGTETFLVMLVEIFNYRNETFEGSLFPGIPTTDTEFMVDKMVNAEDYIGPNGEVAARVGWTRPAGVPPFWNAEMDRIEWEIDL